MRLKGYIAQWESAGLPVVVVPAPSWVTTFDIMVVIYSGQDRRTIRRVAAYSTKDDRLVSEH
jgi:hypothetical protein